MYKRFIVLVFVALLIPAEASSQERLKMSTTTSTDNSGLLEALLPPFEKKHNIMVDVIAVGTGKALLLGENGDVDLVFVHARDAEDRFVRLGYGVNRRDVMYNDFVVLGPPGDPAEIRSLRAAVKAFVKIASLPAPFISRGDDSGTHKKEKKLWTLSGVQPQGAWYQEVGQGMGAVLRIADEKRAYTLSDRGTYLAFKGKTKLAVLCEGDPELHNPYGIIAVNPERHPHVRYSAAMALIAWVTSRDGQKIIRDYGKKKFGRPLFFPLAVTP